MSTTSNDIEGRLQEGPIEVENAYKFATRDTVYIISGCPFILYHKLLFIEHPTVQQRAKEFGVSFDSSFSPTKFTET